MTFVLKLLFQLTHSYGMRFFLYGYKIESFGRLLVFSRVIMEDRDKPPIEIGGS